jgi:hypothetical protein
MGLGVSEIRNKPIPDPGSGSRGQKGTGSRIPDPDPQHCRYLESTNRKKSVYIWSFGKNGEPAFLRKQPLFPIQ